MSIPFKLAEAGSGAVVSADEDPDVKAALARLLELRTAQVTDPCRFKELEYVAGESRRRWLARHGVSAGNVDATRVPYYLLVVGCPKRIPFGFCRELSVEYALRLLSFDTPAQYAAYAASVVAAESDDFKPRSRQVTFFSPRHALDPATQRTAPVSSGQSTRDDLDRRRSAFANSSGAEAVDPSAASRPRPECSISEPKSTHGRKVPRGRRSRGRSRGLSQEECARLRVLFNCGQDPSIGNRVLEPPMSIPPRNSGGPRGRPARGIRLTITTKSVVAGHRVLCGFCAGPTVRGCNRTLPLLVSLHWKLPAQMTFSIGASRFELETSSPARRPSAKPVVEPKTPAKQRDPARRP
jgi:hypothetical protein